MKSITWPGATGHETSNGMTATVNSDPITINNPNEDGIFIQLAWTSTPVGTLKLQASNDGILWVDLDGMTSDTGGAASNAAWCAVNCTFQYLRVVYTRSSSSGTLTGTYNIKRRS